MHAREYLGVSFEEVQYIEYSLTELSFLSVTVASTTQAVLSNVCPATNGFAVRVVTPLLRISSTI